MDRLLFALRVWSGEQSSENGKHGKGEPGAETQTGRHAVQAWLEPLDREAKRPQR